MGRINFSNLAKVVRHPLHYLGRIHPFLAAPGRFFLQSEMDISPRSIWHNPEFTKATGGFLIPEDPVDRRICELDSWDRVRRDMLVLQMRGVLVRQVEGDFAELGVYKGVTARLIHQYAPERRLHLFDTFTGFDDREIEAASQRGVFSDTSVEGVMKRIAPRNDNIEVYAGRFPQTAATAPDQFAFVHLDADLFEPIKAGLEFFYPRLSPRGVIVIHDYNAWPGARRAVDEFFAPKREVPIAMPDKSGSAVIVKL
jgi:O-methyltransferase